MAKSDIKINYILSCLNKVKLKNASIISNDGLKEDPCQESTTVVKPPVSKIADDKAERIQFSQEESTSVVKPLVSRITDDKAEGPQFSKILNSQKESTSVVKPPVSKIGLADDKAVRTQFAQEESMSVVKPPTCRIADDKFERTQFSKEKDLFAMQTASSCSTDYSKSEKHSVDVLEELKEEYVEWNVKTLHQLLQLCKNQPSFTASNRLQMLSVFAFLKENSRRLIERPKFSYLMKSLICILIQDMNVYSCLNSNLQVLKQDVVAQLHTVFEGKSLSAKIESSTYTEMVTLLSKVNINFCDKNHLGLQHFCYNVELFSDDEQKPLLYELVSIIGLWPDVRSVKQKNSPTHPVFCNLHVLHQPLHLHFFAYFGNDVAVNLLHMTEELQKHSCRREDLLFLSKPPEVGEMYAFCSEQEKHRVRILEVDNFVAKVLAVDFAIVYPVMWSALVSIPKSIQDIPPLAKLCQIKGVIARPDVPILIQCLELLQNLCSFNNRNVMEEIKINQGDQILHLLTKCPDAKVQECALGCLSNLTVHTFFRCSLLNNEILQEFADTFKYSAQLNSDLLYHHNESLGLMFRIFGSLVAGNKAIQAIYATPEVFHSTKEILRRANVKSVLLRRHAYQFIREVFSAEDNHCVMEPSVLRSLNGLSRRSDGKQHSPKMVSYVPEKMEEVCHLPKVYPVHI